MFRSTPVSPPPPATDTACHAPACLQLTPNTPPLSGSLQVSANVSGCLMSGYLHRRTRQKWKRYWFVLRDCVLYMYRASQDVVAVDSLPVLGYEVKPITDVRLGNVLIALALTDDEWARTDVVTMVGLGGLFGCPGFDLNDVVVLVEFQETGFGFYSCWSLRIKTEWLSGRAVTWCGIIGANILPPSC